MKIESVRALVADADPLRDVSRQFEAVFVNQLIGAMRNTIVKDGYVAESHAEKIYQAMLDQEHASRIAETNELGLSSLIYKELIRSQSR